MKKYSIHTKRAAKEVARYIDVSVYNKRLSFLFGAGINENIAKESLSWSGLAKASLNNFLNDSLKKYNKFEKEAISTSLLSSLNNKLAISFEPKKPTIEIYPKKDEQIEWFITGFDQISRKMNGAVEIMTLNYDHVLSDVLHRNPINFLKGESVNASKEVLHLHGMVDKQKIVSADAVLTMSDYVNNSSLAEERLTKFLLRENKDQKIKNETLIIIGSSLQEEHILRAFRKYKKRDENRVNILLITHQPKDKYYINRLNEIYGELGVKIININANKDYKDDFIDFWELLSAEMQNPIYSPIAGGITGRDDIIDSDLYFKVKEFLKGSKGISLEEMFDKLNMKNVNNSTLIRPIFWLEKSDKILKKGELKRYAFNFMNEIPIRSIHFFYEDIETKKDITKILEAINKIISGSLNFGHDLWDYDITCFIEKYWEHIKHIDLAKYKNIIKWIFIKSNIRSSKIPSNILEYIKGNYNLDRMRDKDYNFFRKKLYPSKSSDEFKILKKKIIEKEKLNFIIPESKEDIIKLVNFKKFRQNQEQIFNMFLMDEYKEIITQNIEFFIESIVESHIELDLGDDTDYSYYYLHLLLYFVLINDQNYNKEYMKIIKKDKNYPFTEFPRDFEMIGTSNFNKKSFSEFDGLSIFNKKIIFENIGEINKCLLKPRISLDEKESIISYFRNDFSLKKYEEVLSIKKIEQWGTFEKNLSKITWYCKTWKEYYDFVKAYWKHSKTHHSYEFIVIIPPKDIHKRKQELIESLEKEYDEKQYVELSDIVKVQNVNGYQYEDLLWWSSELKILIKYRNKTKYSHELLNKIFCKAFGWKNDTFFKVINGDLEIDTFVKLQLAFLYQGNNFKVFDIDKIIDLHKKSKNEIFDSLFEMVDLIIRMKNRKNWKEDYIKFKTYLDTIDITKQQDSYKKMWFKNIDKVLAYNYISHGIEFDFKSSSLVVSDIFGITSGISDLKNKKIDKRLLSALEKVGRDSAERYNDDLFFLRTFKYENLGEETNEFLFFEIKRRIKLMEKQQRIYGYEFLDDYLKFVDNTHRKELKKIIEKKNFKFVNL